MSNARQLGQSPRTTRMSIGCPCSQQSSQNFSPTSIVDWIRARLVGNFGMPHQVPCRGDLHRRKPGLVLAVLPVEDPRREQADQLLA